MDHRRIQIKQALEGMIYAQRHKEFQWLATQVMKLKWPELEATQELNDGGEDATSSFVGADGLQRSGASSLTGTLAKIKSDANRLRERGVKIDVLVFATPVPVDNLTISDWCDAVKKEFGHELHVIPQAELIAVLEQPQNAWLCRRYLHLDFGDGQQLAEIDKAVRVVAAELLQGWKTEYRYEESKSIELGLVAEVVRTARAGSSNGEIKPFSVQQVLRVIGPGQRITIIGPPGAGKTFTLIQLADRALQDSKALIPVLVSLPGWASSGGDLLSYAAHPFMSYSVKRDDLVKFISAGQAMLLLNGWNEIPESFMDKAVAQLQAFALNTPAAPLLLSSREGHVPPPFGSGRVIRVNPLTVQQKIEMVKRSGLSELSTLIHELEVNTTLADVTDTPLFLAAIIDLAQTGEPLPQTRFEILGKFIERIENRELHSAALNASPCKGQHRRYLDQIAGLMTKAGTTTIPFGQLLDAIAKCSKSLHNDGHMGAIPDSASVADCLAKHHLLVFSPSMGGNYRFVHQQFQEWFAAEWLYDQVAALAMDEAPVEILRFQCEVLNQTHWKQPMVFLIEQLAAGGEGQRHTAAKLIEWASPLDLLLASELAGIGGKPIWGLVREQLGAFLRQWYAAKSERRRYCALAAMLATGAPDFQDIVGPLVESADEQIRRSTYRTWQPFPPTSLGCEWRTRFSAWPAERRAEFIQEMSLNPSQEHIALAKELSENDSSADVKLVCLELLVDVGAYETVDTILHRHGFSSWPRNVLERVLARLPQKYLGAYAPYFKAAWESERRVNERLAIINILQRTGDPDCLDMVKVEMNRILALEGVSFRPTEHWRMPADQKPELPNVAHHLIHYIKILCQSATDWVMNWLANQFKRGLFWWEPFTDYLGKIPDALILEVAKAALAKELDANTLRQRGVLLARSGLPIAAAALVKEYLVLSTDERQPHGSNFNRGDALRMAIGEVPLSILIEAIVHDTSDMTEFEPIHALLDLVMPRAALDSALRFQLSSEQKSAIRLLILRLEKLIPLDFQGARWVRAHLASCLGAVGVPSDAAVLEKWIEQERQCQAAESTDWQAKWQAWERSGRTTRPPGSRGITAYWNWYQGGLIQLRCPEAAEVFARLLRYPEWLVEAAWGLVSMTLPERSESRSAFGERPKYNEIYVRQQNWEGARKNLSDGAKQYAELIFQAIQSFLPDPENPRAKVSNHELSRAAAALAALDDLRGIPLLLKVAFDKYQLWTIVMALHELALRGAPLPGKEIATALEPFISEHEQGRSGNDNWHAVAKCFAVLLFSNNPEEGVRRMRLLPRFRITNYSVRELLTLLSACRAPAAVEYLVELSTLPEVRDGYPHELVAALSENQGAAARERLFLLFDQLCAGTLPSSRNMIDPLSKAISNLTRANPYMCEEIKSRCKSAKTMAGREILCRILHDAGSEEAALNVCELINDEFPIAYSLERVIEDFVLARVPAGGNSYYLRPRAATLLKKNLLLVAKEKIAQRTSALELLALIQQCRLEHGNPANEPLHPDIDLLNKENMPWQLLDLTRKK